MIQMDGHTLSEKIRNIADSTGIDAMGFSKASEFVNYRLNHHQRRDPKLTMPEVKSIIIAGIYIGGVTLPEWKDPWYGRTSRLYLSGFFLDVVKPLEPIADFLTQKGYQAQICDGTIEEGSIIPLKLAAVRAGLGWQGKHSLLISKKYGTFLALGGILTNADLEYNLTEEPNRCRKCTECQKACPVEALEQPHVLNIQKCMSNLLADEHLPQKTIIVMENRIGDCEICQEACPWNKKHLDNPLTTKMTPVFQQKINAWRKTSFLPDLSKLSETQYKVLSGRLNTGIPFHIFQRNVRIAVNRIRMDLKLSLEDQIETNEVIALYKANGWSSAEHPDKLIPALKNSDSLVTARISGKLVGLGNAISDGGLVVYYPHMLVHPAHKGKGIGRSIMELLQKKYASFHQQMLTADADVIGFYETLGFKRAGKTEPMWIYEGNDHG